MKKVLVTVVALGLGRFWSGAQEAYPLDSSASLVQVHLDTAGALGFMGHPHLIQTPIKQGSFVYYPDDPGKSAVELVVQAAALQVSDPKRPLKERQEIQATMQSDRVLGVKQYPEIVFKSVGIKPMGGNRLEITGNLTIRGQTHPVIVDALIEPAGLRLKATGTCRFRQTTFGMRPVTAGLGTVRVRDQVKISFLVCTEPKSGRTASGDDRSMGERQ